jgi:methyl-accepting chemotaxis protein
MRLNMKISKKLVLGFAIVVILTAALGVVAFVNMSQIKFNSDLADNSYAIQVSILEARREEKNFILRSDDQYIESTNQAISNALALCTQIKSSAVNSNTLQIVDDVETGINSYSSAFANYVTAAHTCDSTLITWKATGASFVALLTTIKGEAVMGSDVYLQADALSTAIANMRPSCVYYMKDPSETTWTTAESAMGVSQTKAAELVSMTSGMGQINTDANTILTTIQNYQEKGNLYYQTETALTQADSAMVEAATTSIGSNDPANAYYGGAAQLQASATADLNSVQTSSNIMVIGFVVASIGISVPLAYFIIRSFQNPIKALIEDAKIISEGNLGHKMTALVTKDEVGEVAGAFKNMVTSIRDLVVKVKASTDTVASMSQEVGSTAQEVNAGMEQVSTATQNISQGAQKLTNLAQEVSKNVNTLSSVLQQTGGTAADSIKFGEKSTEIMKKIQSDSGKASESIENMQNAMVNTAQTVESMHASLAKIGELANMVTDVASQTEMLALNAAIEAARAGEAGRGFAVVADAVKELSDQSSNAANETLQSVSQVKKKGEEALEVSKQSTLQATEGASTVKASIDGTRDVAAAIEKINTMLTDVGKGVEQGVVAVEQVVKAIEEVTAISEESASACEENSSAMEQQSASMNQLAETSTKLSEVATQLQKEIEKFKL